MTKTPQTELNELRAELHEWRKFIIPTICETPQQCREWVDKNMYIDGVSGVIIANVLKKENDELREKNEQLRKTRENYPHDILTAWENQKREIHRLEIERNELRAKLEKVNQDNADLSDRLTGCELHRDDLGAEIEKLKEEREQWRMSSVCRELRAENDELRAKLK